MKQQSTTSTKGTSIPIVYKSVPYGDCKHHLVKIVKAHFVYSGYLNTWGKIFTAGELRSELNINLGNLIARCFNVPDQGKAITKILSTNMPGKKVFDQGLEVILSKVFDHCINTTEGNTIIKFNHETVRELIFTGSVIEFVSNEMGKPLFGDGSSPFQYVCDTDCKMSSGMVLEVVEYILDIDDANAEPLWRLSTKLNPFTSTVNDLIDKWISQSVTIIETLK